MVMPVGPYTVIASVRLVATGDTAIVEARLRNDGRQASTVNLGACALSVSISRADLPGGKPAWDQRLWQPNGDVSPSIGRVCPLYEVRVPAPRGLIIAPTQLAARYSTRSLLNDSLPPGRYLFSARIAFNDTDVTAQLGTLMLKRP